MPAVSAKVRRWVGLAALLAAALPVAGCKKPPPPTPVAVKGRAVDAADKPLTNLLLVFHPQDRENQARVPSAVLDKDGRFETRCLPGRYRVTLGLIPVGGQAPARGGTLADPGKADTSGLESIPAAYRSSAASPWEITIPENGNENLTLNLKPVE